MTPPGACQLKRTGKSHIKGKCFLFSATSKRLAMPAQNGAMSVNQKRLFFSGFTVGADKELLGDGSWYGTFVTATQEFGWGNEGLQDGKPAGSEPLRPGGGATRGVDRLSWYFGPQCAGFTPPAPIEIMNLNARKPETERRKWDRLPLAIPVFVRSADDSGKEFLEFATAWNVSAGGALVAVTRSLRLSSQVSLEIPSAPLSTSPLYSNIARNFRAQAIWVTHAEGHQIVGLKFLEPLLPQPAARTPRKRKVASSK
jgi:PilZ domain